jgi:hypothetical protein
MQRMKEFELIKQDVGGVNDNCIYEIETVTYGNTPILKLKDLCPSGVTFIDRNKDIIKEYL